MSRGGPCQYDVLLNQQGVEVHATYCPFSDGYWCIHLTIVDHNGGQRWHFGWKRNSQGNREWIGIDNSNPYWVNDLFQVYAYWLLGNDFRCQSSIYNY